MARTFTALASLNRLKILGELLSGERTVEELMPVLAFHRSALSKHISRLSAAGIVQIRKDGALIYYSLGKHPVREYLECMDQGAKSP